MKNNYYLAIDIGASSGRHILGTVQNGKLILEEIYRFENDIKNVDGNLVWDIENLTENVISGIAKCKEIGKIPQTVAIDTWGVDYVLLDDNKSILKPVFAYRDSRTENIPEEIDKIISRKELYERTGISAYTYNSIYQLYCDKKSGKLQKAKHFLMTPDYLSYKLTGIMANEYTIATTSGLVNPNTHNWDYELIKTLGFNKDMFLTLSKPATELGAFSEEIEDRVGFSATVVHAPSHDTASAVSSCPIDDNSVFISSGTWSLIGTENKTPVLDFDASKNGFSNEGGVEYRFRFLENIIGMWFFQNIRKNLNKKYTYDEMMYMAQESNYEKLIDTNDVAFLAPENMLETVREMLGDKSLPIADVLKSVYLSLAYSYDNAIKTIEKYSNKKIDNILIVGGGSKDKYLNELTANITGKNVLTGLSEGTATGNLLSQIMYSQNISLQDAREIIKKSFDIKVYS